MHTHGVGIWLAMSISGAAVVAGRTAPVEAAPAGGQNAKADEPAYIDTNLDEKAARAAKKAATGAKTAAEETGKVLSDGWITSKVKTKLMADEAVDASGIHVETTKRVVTLNGRVDDEAERARAIEVAKETQGVYGVVDDLKIGPPARVQTPDRQAGRAVPTPGEVTGTTPATSR